MSKTIKIIIAVIIIGGLSYFVYWESTRPGKLDAFATCIKESGTKFYGAFWCKHCQAQKKLFGRSQKLLPYIECSTANGQGQLKVCTDAGVKGYPHWVFADGSIETGEVPLSKLAEKTSCELPQE